MGLKEWFRGKRKEEPKASETPGSNDSLTQSPQERAVAKQKLQEDIDSQLEQLRAMADAATDPTAKARLEELLRKRQSELRK